jgi:hypothetical protein
MAPRRKHGTTRPQPGSGRGAHPVAAPILSLLLLFAAAGAHAKSDRAQWRVGWANDDFVGSDDQFTNGVFVQLHSAPADALAATSGTPAFGKPLARLLLPRHDGLRYRESWTLGHNMQTPNRIDTRDLVADDVPYVGMAGWSNAFYAFDDRRMTGFGLLLGWVGDLTAAEWIQRTTHAVTGATEPRGWHNQLDNEPLLNLYAMHKRKFFDTAWMDAAWNVDAALGNFFTHAQAALELRFGRRPGGFVPTTMPTGYMLDHDARIRAPGESLYASVIVRGTALGFALPRHGNLLRSGNRWTETERIDAERLLGQLVLGLHYERPRWGVHFQLNLATDAVEPTDGGALEDPRNNFGMLVFERSF